MLAVRMVELRAVKWVEEMDGSWDMMLVKKMVLLKACWWGFQLDLLME